MPGTIGKRKREEGTDGKLLPTKKATFAADVHQKTKIPISGPPEARQAIASHPSGEPHTATSGTVNVQIVTGSYERVLHGICASFPSKLLQKSAILKDTSTQDNRNDVSTPQSQDGPIEEVSFSDTYLFAAHASSIRCLALSPATESNKRILATGSSDERINLYNVSTIPPTANTKPTTPSLAGTPIAENALNRSIGTLNHHTRAISTLHFSTKSKLFSGAEDNTVGITRTKDFTLLSAIKAPIPKPAGRPSGDTAAPGEVPAGINAFAIHPSQKLMLSLSRGEKCMRLWNLMTGKKAGVLQFSREVLGLVGEGRHSSGEGKKVVWDGEGEVFVVGFERGAVLFGIDSKPRAVLKPSRPTKFHEMRFLSTAPLERVLAVSTEDGRVLFFDTRTSSTDDKADDLSSCTCVAQLGGALSGIGSRVKDFEVLQIAGLEDGGEAPLLMVTGHSDGAVRLWTISTNEIVDSTPVSADSDGETNGTKQVGQLIGTLETGNRITCLGAFVMDGKATSTSVGEQDDVFNGFDEDDEGSEEEDEDEGNE